MKEKIKTDIKYFERNNSNMTKRKFQDAAKLSAQKKIDFPEFIQ